MMRKIAFLILLIFVSSILFADVYEELENSNKLIEKLVAQLEAKEAQIADLQKIIENNTAQLERDKQTIQTQNNIIKNNTKQLEENKNLIREKDKELEKMANRVHNYRFSIGGGITYPVGGQVFLSYKPFEKLPLGIYMTNYLMRYDDKLLYAPGIGVQYFIK